jgi:hypothetical protein
MIHGAMLYFSEKGRNTRMPKTTTRQQQDNNKTIRGEKMRRRAEVCVWVQEGEM